LVKSVNTLASVVLAVAYGAQRRHCNPRALLKYVPPLPSWSSEIFNSNPDTRQQLAFHGARRQPRDKTMTDQELSGSVPPILRRD
jgi:hypothetical protein